MDGSRRIAALLAFAVAAALAGPISTAAGAPTRAEYIRAADKICAQSIKPTNRAWRGFDENLDEGRFGAAADQVERVRRLLSNSVRRVAALKRPAGDGPLLGRMFRSKWKEVRLYKRSERAFRNENEKGGLAWIRIRLRQRHHSRRIVAGYGFNRCAG